MSVEKIMKPEVKLLRTEKIRSFDRKRLLEETIKNNPQLSSLESKVRSLESLIEPLIYARELKISEWDEHKICFDEGALIFSSGYLASGLKDCSKAILVLVTLGKKLPAYADECNQKGLIGEAVLADLLGSEFIEKLTEHYYGFKQKSGISRGFFPTLRFSPGYGDWELKEQSLILPYLGAEEDVVLTPEYLLVPIKTITAIWGWSTKPQKKEYPRGNIRKGFCAGETTCANCRTWACKKQEKK